MKFSSQGAEPQDFTEICRLATAKHLPGPDEYLTAQAVHQVNTGQINSQAATEALCRRLRQVCAQGRREQKIVLALNLIEQILAQCKSRLNSHQESELMQEIGRVAILPMDRFAPNLRTAQDSKTLALKIISQYQHGPQSPNKRQSEGSESSVKPRLTSQDAIRTCLLRANAQIELVQEAVVPMSCSDAHSVSASDRKFLEASVGALQSYKNDLEMAINYLASHETEASATMMADCLKVTDALNTIITVYHEVMDAQQQQGSKGASRVPAEEASAPVASASSPVAPQQPALPQKQPVVPQKQLAEPQQRFAVAQQQQTQAHDLLLPGFENTHAPPGSADTPQPSTTKASENAAMLKEMGWL
ncbi:g4869 [Coccomyxa viridis]|uniref:G4869 protein n=1 Tax=Coccomyxa viridis TaxID=1274662 RepID=A0ABP1FVC6_9CHLO